jgi:tRNA pseudouridine55 synthase
MDDSLRILSPENFDSIDFQEGTIILVDKPKDWTSFDVVNKVRGQLKRALGVKKIKVGHSGTLDPMATGLLLLCTGKYTKLLHTLQNENKTYTGRMVLGATTPSYDAESEINEKLPIDHITEASILQTVPIFKGEIEQMPPMFSAIKVNGQPLYKLARRGESIELEPRKIRIDTFDITNIELPYLEFEVACSKGTYIRSLAHDFGRALNSGAYLDVLRRTRVGDFSIDKAWNLDDLVTAIKERFLTNA